MKKNQIVQPDGTDSTTTDLFTERMMGMKKTRATHRLTASFSALAVLLVSSFTALPAKAEDYWSTEEGQQYYYIRKSIEESLTAELETPPDLGEFAEYLTQFEVGDVNCDGFVDALDATEVMIYYAYIATNNPMREDAVLRLETLGDANGDTLVDVCDASDILVTYTERATLETE